MAARQIRKAFWIVLAAILASSCTHQDPLSKIEKLLVQGKAEQALRVTEAGLSHELPTAPNFWKLSLRKVEILEKLNRREEALGYLKTLLPPRGAPPDLATLLVREQASIETALGRFRDADDHLLEAIALAKAAGNERMVVRLKIRRAYVLLPLSRFELAEQCLSEAEEYARRTNDHSLDAYILHYEGKVRTAQNQFEDSIPPLSESLRLFQQSKERSNAANVMVSLGWAYYRLGQGDKAIHVLQEALKIADPDDRHLALGDLGNIYQDETNFAEASRYFKEAAALAKGRKEDFEVIWLNNLVRVLIDQGNWAEAEAYNKEAVSLGKRVDAPHEHLYTLLNTALIESHHGHLPEGERILQTVAKSFGDMSLSRMAHAALAGLYASGNRPDDAKHEFDSALKVANDTGSALREDENKLVYLSTLANLYRQYVDFLMGRDDTEAAFLVAESSRARLLRERLNVQRADRHHYSIAEYEAAASKSGATLLAYWIGPERSYLWAISGSHLACYHLPPEREITSLVEKYQNGVERAGQMRPDERSAGAKLFQILVAQHPGLLKPGGKYLIVPDGPLYALNFETLPVPGEHPHFWIEDATIAVAPSLELLLARNAPPRRGRSLLLVGNATEWSPQYPKLQHAGEEIQGVEEQFPAVERTVLTGNSATPVAYVKAQPARYAYIHFAAHATANKNSPFDSAIILSRDSNIPNPTGKLSVKEVLSTPVHADLVTISACYSAGARTYQGEGLVGFAWAFLQSGARDVIAGLWDVSDYSSPRLMRDLYAGLAKSESSADALRAAKLQLIRTGKYANPYYWGAFQLYEGALSAH